MIAAACAGKGAGPKVIVEKSTVPVKTAQTMSRVRAHAACGVGVSQRGPRWR